MKNSLTFKLNMSYYCLKWLMTILIKQAKILGLIRLLQGRLSVNLLLTISKSSAPFYINSEGLPVAKQRYINTKFWDDSYIIDLDPIEKLLFLYLLTNPLTDICGIYEISLKRIGFDTGIDKDMVYKILNRFGKDNKIVYDNSWVAIKNFIKHQALNPKIEKGIEIGLNKAPKPLKEWVKELTKAYQSLSKPLNYSNLNTNLNTNTNTNEDRNIEKEIKKEKAKNKDKEITRKFEEIYSKYPNKKGKDKALGYFKDEVITNKDFENIQLALENYIKDLKSNQTGAKFIQHASTWFNNWRDWIEYKEPEGYEEVDTKDFKVIWKGGKNETTIKSR